MRRKRRGPTKTGFHDSHENDGVWRIRINSCLRESFPIRSEAFGWPGKSQRTGPFRQTYRIGFFHKKRWKPGVKSSFCDQVDNFPMDGISDPEDVPTRMEGFMGGIGQFGRNPTRVVIPQSQTTGQRQKGFGGLKS